MYWQTPAPASADNWRTYRGCRFPTARPGELPGSGGSETRFAASCRAWLPPTPPKRPLPSAPTGRRSPTRWGWRRADGDGRTLNSNVQAWDRGKAPTFEDYGPEKPPLRLHRVAPATPIPPTLGRPHKRGAGASHAI